LELLCSPESSYKLHTTFVLRMCAVRMGYDSLANKGFWVVGVNNNWDSSPSKGNSPP